MYPMKKSESQGNKGKMTRFGIGPIIAPLSIFYFLAAYAVSGYAGALFAMTSIPDQVRVAIACLLLLVGIPFYLVAVISMSRSFDAEILQTHGAYAYCQNPIYAAWILFIVPALAFLVNSWLCLTTSLVMCILLKIFIKKEEDYLKEMFGDTYLLYKKNTPELLPIGLLKIKRIK